MSRNRRPISEKSRRLFTNTVLLYVMTFSAQLFNLATIPYLSRVLGPEVYGKVGIALSYMAYVQVIVDFGFILSATRKVAENREDKVYLSKLTTCVAIGKLMLGAVASGAFLAIVFSTQSMRGDASFYVLYLLSQIIFAMMPDFLYRGLEDMKIITYRTVAIKAFFMVLTFMLVKRKEDLLYVPLINVVGNASVIISMYLHTARKLQVRFVRVPFGDVWRHMADSSQFFASRISSVIYQASNTIILSFLYQSSPVTIGYYTSADKILSLAKSGASPIADSLFPYMVKNRNFKLVKKIMLLVMPVVAACVAVCAAYPNQICAFVFGQEYGQAGRILQLLLPNLFVIFPNYVLAFPVMIPLGLTRQANLSNVYGLGLQAALLGLLLSGGWLDVYTLCIATSITQVYVFLYRLVWVWLTVQRHPAAAKPTSQA